MVFFEIEKIPIKVVQSKKISVEENINITETELKYDKKEEAPIFFYNNGYSGISFDIEAIIKSTETFNRKYVDIPNGKYIIKSIKKEQEFFDQSNWNISFKQYYEPPYKSELSREDSTGANSLNIALSKIEVPLNIGSNKTENIRLLQQKLRKLGYYLFNKDDGLYDINGVYDSNLANAVMRLQADYKKYYHLNVNGIFDTETRDCLVNL